MCILRIISHMGCLEYVVECFGCVWGIFRVYFGIFRCCVIIFFFFLEGEGGDVDDFLCVWGLLGVFECVVCIGCVLVFFRHIRWFCWVCFGVFEFILGCFWMYFRCFECFGEFFLASLGVLRGFSVCLCKFDGYSKMLWDVFAMF